MRIDRSATLLLLPVLAVVLSAEGQAADAASLSYRKLERQLEEEVRNLPAAAEMQSYLILLRTGRPEVVFAVFDQHDFWKAVQHCPEGVVAEFRILEDKSKEAGAFDPEPLTAEQRARAEQYAAERKATEEREAARKAKEEEIAKTITEYEIVHQLPVITDACYANYHWGPTTATYDPKLAGRSSKEAAELHEVLGDSVTYGDVLVQRWLRGDYQGQVYSLTFKVDGRFVSLQGISKDGFALWEWPEETPLTVDFRVKRGPKTMNGITALRVYASQQDPNAPVAAAPVAPAGPKTKELTTELPAVFRGVFTGYDWDAHEARYVGDEVISKHSVWKKAITDLHALLGDKPTFDKILICRLAAGPNKGTVRGVVIQSGKVCVGINAENLFVWTDQSPLDESSSFDFSLLKQVNGQTVRGFQKLTR